MRAVPEGLDERDLFGALRDGWGIDPAEAVYAPVGGGSYHWQVDDPAGGRHWVTVDDLDDKGFLGTRRGDVWDALGRAFDVSRALCAGGLEFVVAPVPARDGASLWRLGQRHTLAVFPFVAAPAGHYGERRTGSERAAVVDTLVRLHRAPPGPARLAPPEVPHRAGLERALAELDQPWSNGPYAERARARLTDHANAVRQWLDRFDRLAEQVQATGAPLVLTHGEPHPGNVVFAADRILLVDWDTAALARPERDLWMLDTDEERARYTEGSGRPVDDAAIELYRLRWKLDDIAAFVHLLRSPHRDNADTARMWSGSLQSLESERVWPYARP